LFEKLQILFKIKPGNEMHIPPNHQDQECKKSDTVLWAGLLPMNSLKWIWSLLKRVWKMIHLKI